ncbi:uncharacterized protein LOC132614743 [Lycium barbarum]|uniref:uncharacterized protein LOC132614743 n=1 Tax=Lycium barbarum TaxID=112863 RepID=UPI00293E02A6|nr:uncharacterized protein LOC132614743 [Lycium barbarum]
MLELGFPKRFQDWVLLCVKTVSYSIIVNGEPAPPFPTAKRLRQGDPLSSFLFAIVMEYLSRNLHRLKQEKQFKFHPRCAKLGITHLSFADDLLLFARGDILSASYIHQCFNQFAKASGLQANLTKSSVYFGGVNQAVQQDILQALGTQRMVARISSWTAKKLSYAGRTQLVQTVLFGIQAYWAQLFKIPIKVLKTIEAFCRSYIWSGENVITKRALVAWERMCTPKSVGGLILINLKLWNKVATAQNHWDLAHKTDKLWVRWIHSYYIKGQQLDTIPIPQHATWMIRQIIDARQLVNQCQVVVRRNRSLIRHIYLQLLGQLDKIPWKCVMLKNEATAKAKYTMWLHFYGKMLTSDRLLKWGVAADPVCVLCKWHNETRNHIFAECDFTRGVWVRLLAWMQRSTYKASTWSQYMQWATTNAKGKSQTATRFQMMFAETVHMIWIERNKGGSMYYGGDATAPGHLN